MTNPNWYRNSFRRNLVDMHIEDWNPEFLSQFDPDEYYANLVRAHVKSPMIYLQSHVGHCNWDTKSGHRHQSFTDCTKKMQRLFDLCHKGGMDVVAYYSMIYNNDAYIAHPEWRLRDINGHSTRFDNGKGQYFGGTRYGLCCPNSPGYRDFVLKQLDEIFDLFTIEGIFLDMLFWTRPCYCDSCKARWKAEHGGDIPTVINWNNPDWRAFQAKREEWMQDFAMMITNKIKSRNPNCSVEHQYSTMMHGWRQGVNHNIAVASDYCGGDFYGGAPQHSIACKLYYNMTANQPFEYMTSRCYPGLHEHTTTKTEDMLRLSVMSTLAHHGAALLIDAIDPKGTLDSRLYETYGKIYADAEKLEPYMEGTLVQDVQVLFNLEGKYNPNINNVPIGTPRANDDSCPHTSAVMGACRSLQRMHIPFGVFSNWKPEKADGASIIVLADTYDLPQNAVDYVKQFVSNGGNLYMSGRVNPELVQKLTGIRLDGPIQTPVAYMVPTTIGQPLFTDHNHDYPFAITCGLQNILLPNDFHGDVLATTALPYDAPPQQGELHPDESDGFDYTAPQARFASIHSNPPGRFTNTPSLIKTTYEKGTVIYSAAPFETLDRPATSPLFANIMNLLNGDRQWSFSSNAPQQVEVIEFDAPAKHRRYINLINSQDSFQIPAICDFDVSVQLDTAPSRILSLPDETPLPFIYENGCATFHVSKLPICNFYAVELS